MSVTLQEALAKLAEYKAAETKVLEAKQVRLGGAGMDRWEAMEDLAEIRRGINEWQGHVNRLEARAQGRPTFGGMTYTTARFDC